MSCLSFFFDVVVIDRNLLSMQNIFVFVFAFAQNLMFFFRS